MEGPLPAAHPWPADPARDDFDGRELALCWNCIRNPQPSHWSLGERPGWLCLHGPAADINNMQPVPCFVGRRQRHHCCRVAALLEFEPERDGDEAGLTAFQNMWHHYEIAVTRREGTRCVLVRRRIGSLQAEAARRPLPPGPVVLTVTADRERYRFSYAPAGGQEQPLAEGEARYLSTEVGGRFTGVYFAMYATGGGEQSRTPAFFDWFEYAPTEDKGTQ